MNKNHSFLWIRGGLKFRLFSLLMQNTGALNLQQFS